MGLIFVILVYCAQTHAIGLTCVATCLKFPDCWERVVVVRKGDGMLRDILEERMYSNANDHNSLKLGIVFASGFNPKVSRGQISLESFSPPHPFPPV